VFFDGGGILFLVHFPEDRRLVCHLIDRRRRRFCFFAVGSRMSPFSS
jgi:hypothetical protein